MTNKFKAALAATSLAGVFIATGVDVKVDGFEVDVVQNQAVAAIVSEAVAGAKAVEPTIILALDLGNNRSGRGGRGDGNLSKDGQDRGSY